MDTNNDQLLHPLLSNMDNFGRYGSSSNLSDNSSISSSRPSSSARGSLLGQSHEHHRDLRSSSTGIQDNVDDVRFEEIPPGNVNMGVSGFSTDCRTRLKYTINTFNPLHAFKKIV